MASAVIAAAVAHRATLDATRVETARQLSVAKRAALRRVTHDGLPLAKYIAAEWARVVAVSAKWLERQACRQDWTRELEAALVRLAPVAAQSAVALAAEASAQAAIDAPLGPGRVGRIHLLADAVRLGTVDPAAVPGVRHRDRVRL